MRRALTAISVLGAVLLVVGICWCYRDRGAGLSVEGSGVLALGSVLCLGAVAGLVAVERRPGGLVVAEGERLPAPHWAGPVALVGLCDLVGGLWASVPLALLGVLLIAVAAIGFGTGLQRSPRSDGGGAVGPDRATVVAARRIRSFAEEHSRPAPGQGRSGAHREAGDPRADVVLEHLGEAAVRIVVVAADGAYGDVVVDGLDRAHAAARLAGATVHEEFTRELGARVRTGSYEWERMAGTQLRGGDAGS